MPIKLANLASKTDTATFNFQGDECTIVYRPNWITPERQAALSAAQAEGKADEQFRALVIGLIESWDVLGDDGQPVPVTDEWIGALPYSFLTACITAAVEAATAGEAGRP